jgi:Calcineurin-like phosphoesterase
MSTAATAASRGPVPQDSPRLRFYQWNDLHISATREPYPGAAQRRRWALDCALGRQTGFAKPDFILSLGDLIDGGPEARQRTGDFAKLREELLDPLGDLPLLPCVGNHENDHRESEPAFSVEYEQCFGPHRRNYAFQTCGVTFVVIDTSGAELPAGDATAARNSFARRALNRFADGPLVVVSHAPLLYVRDPKVLAQSFGLPNWHLVDPQLRQIVAGHAQRVIAVISGHLHLSGMAEQDALVQIVPCGVGGYPADMAAYELYEDRLEVRFHTPPTDLLDKRGDIHGPPRYQQSFTDSEHSTHEAYLWGNANERSKTIRLDGAKRPDPAASTQLVIWEESSPDEWRSVTV